ncbi:MAG: IS66 family transposase, partial [Polaribacter sp.]
LQKTYAMERKIKEKQASVELIKRYRLLCAISVLEGLKIWLLDNKNKVFPKSSIAKAINYTLNIFENLKRCTTDGRFEIDNNNIENAIRPLALGRKNYLFAGSHKEAQQYAMFYSFFATCKINKVNPYKWMHYVIDNISEHKANKLNLLLPCNCNISQ